MTEQITPIYVLASDLPKLVFAAPLSKSTTFSLRVEGPFGEREAAALLRLLQVQIEVLRDESEPLAGEGNG